MKNNCINCKNSEVRGRIITTCTFVTPPPENKITGEHFITDRKNFYCSLKNICLNNLSVGLCNSFRPYREPEYIQNELSEFTIN
jgi:hypothetical protein